MTSFFEADSPFRNPPATIEPRQVVALDGLRIAFDILALAYDNLLDSLAKITQDAGRRPSTPLVTAAYLNAWTILDGAYRLWRLLQGFRGLKRTPALEVELRALAAVEDFRHTFQHLDERIAEAVDGPHPLWGSISWLWSPEDAYHERATSYTLVAGAIRSGYHPALNPLGRSYYIPLGLVTLRAFGHEIEISALMQRVRRLAQGLDKGLRLALSSAPRAGADMLVAMTFAFGTDQPPPTPGAT